MNASDFEAAGLYDPDAENAADRLALLGWLTEQGFTLEELTTAHAEHRLAFIAGDAVVRPGERITLEEVAERAGLPLDECDAIRGALGYPNVAPDEAAFTPEDANTFFAVKVAAQLMGDVPVLEFGRVIGSSFARIAESAIWMFFANVEASLVESGSSDLARAKATFEATTLLVAVPEVMNPVFRFHVQEAIRRSRAARAGAATFDSAHLGVGFVDLVGYTPMSQQLSGRELGRLVAEFESIAYDVVTAHDGRLVKLIGDEVMFVAVDPVAVCEIASTLIERYGFESEAIPRGGLAVGDLLTRGGDYYGPVVNTASRIADLAVPNELLVTSELRDEVSKVSDAFHFDRAGRRMLKGFDEPVELFSLSRA